MRHVAGGQPASAAAASAPHLPPLLLPAPLTHLPAPTAIACRQLVAAAGSIRAELDSEAFQAQQLELPSLSAAWFLDDAGGGGSGGGEAITATSPELAAVSRRILALQQLLGGGGVDVVWMLVREPRLLSADFRG